jgi:RNA polymerase sigma factor (TIGR02999 family)
MPLVVDDLRRIARNRLAREAPGHTLQPTALVNEAYLRLASRRSVTWRDRAQFFGCLAGMMREILVDHARRQSSEKRGGGVPKLSLDEALDAGVEPEVDLLEVDAALGRLAGFDPRQARIVELRFFAGLTAREVAEVLEVSRKTVQREWKVARLWLARELSGDGGRADGGGRGGRR